MKTSRRLYPQEMAKVIQAQQKAGGRAPAAARSPSVTIGLVSYNRWRFTQRCLDSIYADDSYPFQVLIVDSSSDEGTVSFLEKAASQYAGLRVVFQAQNEGLNVARNLLIDAASSDFLYLMDNDVVCHPGWLAQAVEAAGRFEAAFVASLLLDGDRRVWSLATDLVRSQDGAVIEIARWFHHLTLAEIEKLLAGGECRGNFLPGGAALARRRDLLALGGFDENYFLGFGDLDFSLKLATAGYEVWSAHRSRLTHDDEWRPQSAAEKEYVRNRYDMARLKAQAAYFRSKWQSEPLPAQYVDSIEGRLERKLGQ